MQYEKIPQNGGIPKLGLGTWEVGGHMSPDYSQDERVVQAWRAAIDIGYRHIDTAEMYGGGHTEELVRRAIQGVDRRDLFLTSKVWHTNLHYQEVLQAADDSLKRLGTDYLDLYLIHWPNENVPLEETFRALNELLQLGKVRHLGVSNFNVEQLRQAQQLCESPLFGDQVPYSLSNREYAENGVLEYCQENGMILTAYTPVEKGKLANNALLQEIAAKHDATPIQVALKWLIRQPQVITIPMSTHIEHLQENLEAVDVQLSEEDVERLDRVVA